jgi:small-conductance mechanosensitive channel
VADAGQIPVYFGNYLIALIVVGVLAGVGIYLARSTGMILVRRGASPAIVRGTRVLIGFAFATPAVVVVIDLVGTINLGTGVTVSAFLGLAVTLALQTTLQNIIAGFILFQNRFLRLNDVIEISGVKGRVVQVGIVTTWLRLDDGSVASVSNSNLLSGPLRNHSAAIRLRGEF